MSQHAVLSPSGAHGWMRCAGWESDPKSSKYADWGTAAHELAAMALVEKRPAAAYINRLIKVEDSEFKVDHEMADCVQTYLDYVQGIPGELLVEQRLSISHITGEDDAFGTSDAVIIAEPELIVVDLKAGKGVVVEAEGNEQLQIYALAALREFAPVANVTQVRMVIVQPRIGAVSEAVRTAAELEAFAATVRRAAEVVPGEKQCRWCKNKPTCPALAAEVKKTVFDDFESLDKPTPIEHVELARVLPILGLIEDWCTAVAAHAEALALRGEKVPGYKLVKGRAGARAWSDKDAAEEMLRKRFRLTVEQAYNLSLISPTQAEKLVKEDVIGEKQWQTLKGLVTQAEGKPTLVPESDKRPALEVTPVIDDFQEVSA